MTSPPPPKFYLGEITILQHAEEALRASGQSAASFLYEHAYRTPDELIERDEPVINSYALADGSALIIITDRTRTHTVLMTNADRPTL